MRLRLRYFHLQLVHRVRGVLRLERLVKLPEAERRLVRDGAVVKRDARTGALRDERSGGLQSHDDDDELGNDRARVERELAAELGEYESYKGSPASMGLLQYDLWGVEPSGRWDWRGLKANITNHGLRNSLLLAPMPTASTAQILGNNECFEPYTSNLYTRRVLAGEFAVVNKYLLNDLIARGLWTPEIRNQIIADKGSVQGVAGIPDDLKALYKTTWEIKQKCVLDMSADRGAFICQSQSLNYYMERPTIARLSSAYFYAWKKGLKTGMYYLRTKSAVDAIKFTIDNKAVEEEKEPATVEAATTKVAAAAPITTKAATQAQTEPVKGQQIAVDPLSPEELKQMLSQSQNSEDDDCLMCGS